jgi:hypothetical protein
MEWYFHRCLKHVEGLLKCNFQARYPPEDTDMVAECTTCQIARIGVGIVPLSGEIT